MNLKLHCSKILPLLIFLASFAGVTTVFSQDTKVDAAIPGCADWPTWKFLQTPFSNTANGNGWSKAGASFYGENLHVRCNSSSSLNDYYAVDYALRTGDVVYPYSGGTVIYAGWAGSGWDSMGRIIVIDHGNGYWSQYAHLSQINVSRGQSVGINTVIGKAGGSGYGRDGYWVSHLHAGLYLNAKLAYRADGKAGVYGGQSVEPHHVKYFRNGGGYYESYSRYQSVSY